ncbi:LPS-assembly protein LptD [Verrucomicrobia bacterium S94]|nr:LPS-assembly protein LptD [Verrucomicrobia bacterium S94]
MSKGRPVLFLCCCGMAAAAVAADLDLPKEIPDEPFDLTAARLEFTNDTLIASGGVTGRFENVVIRADRVEGNTASGDLKMEGDIFFKRGDIEWHGSELEYNYIKQEGDFGPSTLNFDPVLMSVDQVQRVSTNEFRLQGAEFTTCPKDHPHFHVRAEEAFLIDEEYLKAKGVTVYIGKVPVFYVPYWRQKLSKPIFSFQGGVGSEWGLYLLTTATVPLTEQVESETDLNLYTRRGVGLGQGFNWDYPNVEGTFHGFYLKDQDKYARYDPADGGYDGTVGDEIRDDRYRLKLEHHQYFDDTFYVNTKWNYLSDPAVIEEFFKGEYRSYAQPENYFSLDYGNSYLGTEAFINKRLNDFYNNTDRYEYSLDAYRTRIPGTPLYFQSENAVAQLERVSGTLDPMAEYDATRLDSLNSLYLPQRLGFLSLVPRATYRATYYSDSVAGGEEMRQIPGAGMQVSFEAARVLSERERWYGKGLRHKIQPYADYIYQDSDVDSSDLYRFDDVDLMQDENKVKIGLRNVLQTKRDNRVSRFIDLDLYTYYLVEDHGSGNNFDSLFIDARMPLTKRVMVDIEGVVDWNSGEVPFFNTRFSYDYDDLILSIEHLYRTERESLWTPRFELFPESRLSLEGYARYNDKDNDLEEIAGMIYANWCCMRYGLGYHFYDENEHQIMFSIGLSAFPQARISSGF